LPRPGTPISADAKDPARGVVNHPFFRQLVVMDFFIRGSISIMGMMGINMNHWHDGNINDYNDWWIWDTEEKATSFWILLLNLHCKMRRERVQIRGSPG
jgi:hypothetical protein